MKLQDEDSKAICGRCRKDPDQPPLYSAANNIDPEPIPPQLPELTLAEGISIVRIPVQMDISRVEGCQYKFKGHVISWMQTISKMVPRITSLPSEFQLLIFKPPSINRLNSEASDQTRRRFHVRRGHIQIWLAYLTVHHPDFQVVTIILRGWPSCQKTALSSTMYPPF